MNSETKKQTYEVEYARTIYFTLNFPRENKLSWKDLRTFGNGVKTNDLVNGYLPTDDVSLWDIVEETDLNIIDGEIA